MRVCHLPLPIRPGLGFDVGAIFSPEHGFRGTADAGEHVSSSIDARTGIPIRSLYDGNTRRPSDEAMRSFDVLVVDMQDVGLRFYTYYIAMLRMMEACADYGHEVIVLDRPNPHTSCREAVLFFPFRPLLLWQCRHLADFPHLY